jgi:hypothetical protein
MANRLHNPFEQWFTSIPGVRAGAKLFFYENNTTTKLATYKEAALSNANLNPITLDENGQPPFAIFLQNQKYTVVLATSTTADPPVGADIIWTANDVSASDFDSFSIRKTGSGNPNGSVAGTAGSAGVLPTEYWDYANEILYICTLTGDALTAEWTAINAASASAIPFPQGRLSLTSGVPVLSADVSAGTAVYYMPYVGNLVPIYNGSTFIAHAVTELTLALASQHALNTLYDVFLFNNSGVVTIVTGPGWSTSTAGSGARGTGAGTTEISRVNGFYTNAVQITGRNGSTTYTIGANLATYVGTISIDGTAGQCSFHTSWGQSRKAGVWNAYNRRPILLKAGDATASWGYASATVRPSNNATANSIEILCGLAECPTEIDFRQANDNQGSTTNSKIGIGFNSTTVMSGFNPTSTFSFSAGGGPSSTSLSKHLGPARHFATPAIGKHTITALESATTNGAFLGGEEDFMLTAKYEG